MAENNDLLKVPFIRETDGFWHLRYQSNGDPVFFHIDSGTKKFEANILTTHIGLVENRVEFMDRPSFLNGVQSREFFLNYNEGIYVDLRSNVPVSYCGILGSLEQSELPVLAVTSTDTSASISITDSDGNDLYTGDDRTVYYSTNGGYDLMTYDGEAIELTEAGEYDVISYCVENGKLPDASEITHIVIEGEVPKPIPETPYFYVTTDGHFQLINYNSGLIPDDSVIPIYDYEGDLSDVFESWSGSFYIMVFSGIVDNDQYTDFLKSITINGNDYEITHEAPEECRNLIYCEDWDTYTYPITQESIEEASYYIEYVREQIAEIEAGGPDNPELPYLKAQLYYMTNLYSVIYDSAGKYILMFYGTLLSTTDLSGNLPITINTEYDNGGSATTGKVDGIMTEYVETGYIDIYTDVEYTSEGVRTYCHSNCSNLEYKVNEGEWASYDNEAYIYFASSPGEYTLYVRGQFKGKTVTAQQEFNITMHATFEIYGSTGLVHVYTASDIWPSDSDTYYKIDDSEWVQFTNNAEVSVSPSTYTVYVKVVYGQYSSEVFKEVNCELASTFAELIPTVNGMEIQVGDTWEDSTELQYLIDNGTWTTYDPSNKPLVNDTNNHTLSVRRIYLPDPSVTSEVTNYNFALEETPNASRMLVMTCLEDAQIVFGNMNCYVSPDGITWQSPGYVDMQQGDVLYLKAYYSSAWSSIYAAYGKVSISGCVDALISPDYIIPSGFTTGTLYSVQLRGAIDGSNMELSSYTSIMYTVNQDAKGMFQSNTETKTFSNFNAIPNNQNAYDAMFMNSAIETVSNLADGYCYKETFKNSNLQSMPLLPHDIPLGRTDLFENIFEGCTFSMSNDGGQTFDFGPNNFTYPVAGCNTPRELAKHMGNSTGWAVHVECDSCYMATSEGYFWNIQPIFDFNETFYVSYYSPQSDYEFKGWQMSDDGGTNWTDLGNSRVLQYAYNGSSNNIIIKAVIGPIITGYVHVKCGYDPNECTVQLDYEEPFKPINETVVQNYEAPLEGGYMVTADCPISSTQGCNVGIFVNALQGYTVSTIEYYNNYNNTWDVLYGDLAEVYASISSVPDSTEYFRVTCVSTI